MASSAAVRQLLENRTQGQGGAYALSTYGGIWKPSLRFIKSKNVSSISSVLSSSLRIEPHLLAQRGQRFAGYRRVPPVDTTKACMIEQTVAYV